MVLYVLAAALNLDATILDGNDLSVIRGSSARLLRIVEDLYAHFRRTFADRAVVERLSVGASELVIRLTPLSVAAPPPDPPAGLSKTKWKVVREELVKQVSDGRNLDEVIDAWLTTRQGRGAARDSIKAEIEAILQARAARADFPDPAAVSSEVEAFRALPEQRNLRHFVFLHACH